MSNRIDRRRIPLSTLGVRIVHNPTTTNIRVNYAMTGGSHSGKSISFSVGLLIFERNFTFGKKNEMRLRITLKPVPFRPPSERW